MFTRWRSFKNLLSSSLKTDSTSGRGSSTDYPYERLEDNSMSRPEEVIDSESSPQHGADTAMGKRVLRKIDMRIIPLLFCTYMLNFMDKTILSSASVFGLRDDLVGLSSPSAALQPTHNVAAPCRPAIFMGLVHILLWLPILDAYNESARHPPPHRPLSDREHVRLGHRRRGHSGLLQLWRSTHRALPFGRCGSHHHPGLHVHDNVLLHAR